MPHLNFTEVLTFSSEDPNHPADNLLKSDTYLKWKSQSGRNENQEYVVLKLEKLSSIRSLDIGNENSAFIEVLVSREEGEFKVLLVASSFMSPLESRNGTNPNRVRMFGSDKLNKSIADQKWDRIKIICTQPFIKNAQCGLTFVKVYGPEEKSTDDNRNKLGKFTILEDDDDDGPLSIGSFFAKRKDKESPPLTGAAAIRAASKMAAQSPEQTKILKRSAEENSSNAPDIGFYQLKKRLKESQDTEKGAQSPEQTTKALKRSSEENSSVDPNIALNQIKKKMKESIGKERSASPSSKSETENQNKKSEVKKSSDSNSTSHRDKKSDSSDTPNSSKTPKKRVTRSFNKLMHDVVFVLSGYQNPQRSNLRDSLIEMGAKYKNDWGNDCTHLICAFRNTPKFQSVKGKGKIVTEKWVEDCYKKKIRFPWRRYNLEKNRSDESEDEIWASEICPDSQNGNERKSSDKLSDTDEMHESEDTDDEIQRAVQKNKQTNDRGKHPDKPKEEKTVKQDSHYDKSADNKSSSPKHTSDDEYDADTDVDEDDKKDTTDLPLPPLKNIFKEKVFFIYGSLDESKKKSLIRYVTAFQGKVSTYMDEEVTYVITDDSWDDNFDNALEDNPNLQFVKSQWIWKCCNSEKMVPPQPFLIVPKDES
ncbi:UNVERIFIED_CONTAM: hypothetical protein RMT77_012464 [Armadillidium vulgare]